jgi:prephenate dehydrogenase
MAGTEKQGFENAFPELFEACNWILTKSSPRTQHLEELIKDLGTGKIVIMDPKTHDEAVAAISHIPLLLSLGLATLLEQVPRAREILGPSFKSMTRLAQGNEKLSQEIINLNKFNIKETWELYKENIDSFLAIQGKSYVQEEIIKIKKNLSQDKTVLAC